MTKSPYRREWLESVWAKRRQQRKLEQQQLDQQQLDQTFPPEHEQPPTSSTSCRQQLSHNWLLRDNAVGVIATFTAVDPAAIYSVYRLLRDGRPLFRASVHVQSGTISLGGDYTSLLKAQRLCEFHWDDWRQRQQALRARNANPNKLEDGDD